MSAPSLSHDVAPPPGLSARTLEDPATLERLLAGAPGHDDIVDPRLFDRLRSRPPLELRDPEADDPPVVYPWPATDASLLATTYSIPLEQAWALLPATERLAPVRVTPRRAAITFFAWQVRRCPLGAFHQLGVALPAVLDAAPTPSPLPPSLWREPTLGFYAVELPVDSARLARIGTQLAGLPSVIGTAELELAEMSGTAHFSFEDRRMADLSVAVARWPRLRRHNLSFTAYSLRAGRIVRVRYDMVGEGYRGRRGRASVTLGEHRRAQRLARLELSRRPLELQVIPRMNLVGWAPEDAGAI